MNWFWKLLIVVALLGLLATCSGDHSYSPYACWNPSSTDLVCQIGWGALGIAGLFEATAPWGAIVFFGGIAVWLLLKVRSWMASRRASAEIASLEAKAALAGRKLNEAEKRLVAHLRVRT